MAKIKLGMSRAGTGSFDNTVGKGGQKWTEGVKAQLNANTENKILAKFLPVNYIVSDPENPRQLAISAEDVKTIAAQFPIDKNALSVEDPNDYLETYIDRVTNESAYKGKALGDLIDIIEFAASLKDASRLLEPIVVLQDDSTFHLIAGERRLFAHILLDEIYIASIIKNNDLSRNDIDIFQWEENVSRKDMTMAERVLRVSKIANNIGGVNKTSVTKLGKIIGKSRAEAQRYLSILRCPHDLLMEAVVEGRIADLKKAAEMAQLDQVGIENILFNKVVKASKPTVKISKSVNDLALRRLIEAAASSLKMKKVLKDHDLTSKDGLAQALEELLKTIESDITE